MSFLRSPNEQMIHIKGLRPFCFTFAEALVFLARSSFRYGSCPGWRGTIDRGFSGFGAGTANCAPSGSDDPSFGLDTEGMMHSSNISPHLKY